MDWDRAKKMSRLAIVVIAVAILLTALVTNILVVVNTGDDQHNHIGPYADKSAANPLVGGDTVVIDSQLRHTFWFMQISDLHLSIYFDKKRAPDLMTFCTQYVEAIRPAVVLVTGDLTDSRTRDPMGSTQHEPEWIMYADILDKCGVRNRTKWLDIRGNHDNFNVYNHNSDENYFKRYSSMGPNYTRSYRYTLKHDTETYSFIGVDACLSPGPKRPFNFVGMLKDDDMSAIKRLKNESIRQNSNTTIWFGHYPTSSIAMPRHGLRDIINGPYFCGHFHTVGGWVQHMYATQPNGYLEIELADWKDLRKIRLAAVDHGLFTFTDFTLNQWPIILVTNPKASLYSMPNFEPYHRIAKSTHIRALVFSLTSITSVKVKVDDNEWRTMRHVSGPLYVYEWSPADYSTGLHRIEVKASDKDNERIERHQFSIDGSKPDFTFGGKFMIRVDVRAKGYFLFAFAVAICVLPLLIFRFIEVCDKGETICVDYERNVWRRLMFKFYLLSNVNKIFYPLIAIPIYATIGPWFVGYMIDRHFAICFAWGMIIDGSYLPGGFTYIMGALLLIFFQLPITFCLAHIVYCRYKQLTVINSPKATFMSTYCHVRHILFLFFVLCHILYSLAFYFAYGILAYVFGFFNSWSFVIYLILWQFALRLEPISFPNSIRSQSIERNYSVNSDNQDEDITNSPFRRNK